MLQSESYETWHVLRIVMMKVHINVVVASVCAVILLSLLQLTGCSAAAYITAKAQTGEVLRIIMMQACTKDAITSDIFSCENDICARKESEIAIGAQRCIVSDNT